MLLKFGYHYGKKKRGRAKARAKYSFGIWFWQTFLRSFLQTFEVQIGGEAESADPFALLRPRNHNVVLHT